MFSLVSDSFESYSLLIRLLASLVIWRVEGSKNAPCNTSHIILICALGHRKQCALTVFSWVDRLAAFQLLFLQNTIYVSQIHCYWKWFVSEISMEGGYNKSNTPNSKKFCSIYTSCKKNFCFFVTYCFPHLAMACISTCQWTLLFLGFCFAGLMWNCVWPCNRSVRANNINPDENKINTSFTGHSCYTCAAPCTEVLWKMFPFSLFMPRKAVIFYYVSIYLSIT